MRKRKRVDFIIYYETVQREYENACLIKAELERRGYSVMICNTIRVDYWKSFFIKPKVIIVHGFYGGHCIPFVTKIRKKINAKVLNLQYEQIVSLSDDENSTQMPSNDERKAYHVCWGPKNYMSCLKNGVDSAHLLRLGAIQFDLQRKEFSDYYISREELCEQYGLHSERKIILFISDFAFLTYGRQSAYNMLRQELGEDAYDVIDYEKKSYDYIMGFIQRYIKSHPEVEYVYRPHPSELKNEQLDIIKDSNPNFHIISELNVKQWIKICDQINTWNSTAISEVYFEKKPCLVIDIPQEELTPPAVNYRIRIIDDSKKITTYNDFEEWNDSINCFSEDEFPINRKTFNEYYGYTDFKRPVYIKLCDELEKIYENNDYMQLYNNNVPLNERLHQLKYFKATLRGNIRFIVFPIINHFFKSKCKIDKYLAQHDPKVLSKVYKKVQEQVCKNKI